MTTAIAQENLQWEYKTFLYSSSNWKNIEVDCIEEYGVTMLEDLNYQQLKQLAEKHNFKQTQQ